MTLLLRRIWANRLFGFGVKFVVDFFEVSVCDVGVDLRSGDIGMAEHGLDGTEISAIHE